jgi:hypothetical protein
MKRSLTMFFQVVVILVGIVTFAFMLWEPHLEGRNVNSTPYEVYFNDPFLAYAYVSSISFFVVLYQIFRVLGNVRQNRTFSQETLKALQTIKYSAIILIGLILGAEAYIITTMYGKDDIAGGVAMGLFAILVSLTIAAAAWKFERILRNAGDVNTRAA